MDTCPFCAIEEVEAVLRNDLAYALFDKHPVNPGHLLILSRRHVPTWFEASPEEKSALMSLVEEGKRMLDNHRAPDGYNIGINVGDVAGQTVMHLHVHLIPRYRGDVENPRGGVRGVVPARQSYPTEGEQS
ncbi:MAG: HIT family protein [Sterolibacteriaceae bacterium]|nr:HIT family protein [Sterolibacteriaceae bacterium]MBK9084090.1 HIT family protein [Sterolibacteriaceae bacterium]